MLSSSSSGFSVGAGTLIQFPLNHTPVHSAEPPADDGRLQDAYLVTPASHIGRVVTGVVLIAEKGGVSTKLSCEFADANHAVAKFGLSRISFADKLAEQGYKVLVVNVTDEVPEITAQMELVDQALLFLRQKQDIQRVATLGVGVSADITIKMAMERSQSMDCAIAMCPEGKIPWSKVDQQSPSPLLLLVGEKNPYTHSEACQALLDACAADHSSQTMRARVFRNQGKEFAFSNITDEDAATQAIAELLDWLVAHLHRFRVACGTSDQDPWWPQGRNGPFLNVGLKVWHETRAAWLSPTQARPPRPPPVPAHLLFDGLSSMRRTFDLPQRMRLGDVIELFAEIWDVQQ